MIIAVPVSLGIAIFLTYLVPETLLFIPLFKVFAVFGDWTGIPVGRMVKNEVEAILKLGVKSQGQGHETTFAQIVAEELGIPASKVMVEEGDDGRRD